MTVNRNEICRRNQFIRIIFIQVFGTAVFSFPWICTYLYYLAIENIIQSNLQLSIIYFLLALTNNLYYVINVKSFYLSILTSRRFRLTLITDIFKLFHKN